MFRIFQPFMEDTCDSRLIFSGMGRTILENVDYNSRKRNQKFPKIPYFKYYGIEWDEGIKNSRWVSKIYFEKPEYVNSKKGRIKTVKLSEEEIEKLLKILNTESHYDKGFTVWDTLKFYWNENYNFFDGMEFYPTLKEYLDGEADEICSKNEGYLPSTLEIPDYTKLK